MLAAHCRRGHPSFCGFGAGAVLSAAGARDPTQPWRPFYWAAQFAAAILASLLLWWIPDNIENAVKLGAALLDGAIGSGAGVAIEAILTFLLVWVIFATAVDPRGTFKSIAGLAIGFTITLDILMGGPLTGAAMNPARALGTSGRPPARWSRRWRTTAST
jgi:glycerol uptake facilitator-like aquaporin